MAASRAERLDRRLRDVVTLGSFSPETFHIYLEGEFVPKASDLSQEGFETLSHEFGHLLHYCTSYIGLRDLSHWVETIAILHDLDETVSAEEANSKQAQLVLSVARSKQTLSIDDEYYFEPHNELYEQAAADPTVWRWGETTGALFDLNGRPTDWRFWALRFFLGSRELDRSLLRIPIGIRTILEHMAKGIDFISEARATGHVGSIANAFRDEAFEPELLHYYALSHRVASEVRKTFGTEDLGWSFLITGIIVATLSEIPFDDPTTWSTLRSYAERTLPHHVRFMSRPHPSYVFPVLLHATFNSDLTTADFLDLAKLEYVADTILSAVQLPPIAALADHRDQMRTKVSEGLQTSQIGVVLAELLEDLQSYSQKLGWAGRLSSPLSREADQLPVPIVFPGGRFIEGKIVNGAHVEYLAFLADRRDQMLRYHYTRNIVDQVDLDDA